VLHFFIFKVHSILLDGWLLQLKRELENVTFRSVWFVCVGWRFLFC